MKRSYEHIQAEESHPGSSVRLSEHPTIGERLGAIKRANVIESEETTLENVLPFFIFSVYPLRIKELSGLK